MYLQCPAARLIGRNVLSVRIIPAKNSSALLTEVAVGA